MTLDYNRTGSDRKRLVTLVSEITGASARYLGALSFAYRVDYFTIDRNGGIHFDDMADSKEIESLIGRLAAEGFECVSSRYDSEQQEPVIDGEEPLEDCPPPYDTPRDDEPCGVCISMPRSLFTDGSLENLRTLVAAKGSLIKKALGAEELPIEVADTKVSFPWFAGTPAPEELKAYDAFICRLCEMARTQKRVVAKEKDVENEKYAFRCFLLRLGFIGAEYKTERKILLRSLSGNGSFKGDARHEVSE